MKTIIDESQVAQRGSFLINKFRNLCLNDETTLHVADFPHKSQRPGKTVLSHLLQELFIQVKGKTIFTFAEREVIIEAGQICFIPSYALHGEKAIVDSNGEFENLVIDMLHENL